MSRYTLGAAVHLIDHTGHHIGGVIANKHERGGAGLADLIVWDPSLLAPQPARLVPYRSQITNRHDGPVVWTWHYAEDED